MSSRNPGGSNPVEKMEEEKYFEADSLGTIVARLRARV